MKRIWKRSHAVLASITLALTALAAQMTPPAYATGQADDRSLAGRLRRGAVGHSLPHRVRRSRGLRPLCCFDGQPVYGSDGQVAADGRLHDARG